MIKFSKEQKKFFERESNKLTPSQKYFRMMFYLSYPPKKINSERENNKYLKILDVIGDIENSLDCKSQKDVKNYKNEILKKIEEFESNFYKEDERLTPLDMLQFLIEQNNLNINKLSSRSGVSSSTLSLILRKKRSISLNVARKLGIAFCVKKTLFLDIES